jgi:hypothetical protein
LSTSSLPPKADWHGGLSPNNRRLILARPSQSPQD